MTFSTTRETMGYFTRLAREVGYWNFVIRYSLRKLHKLLKVEQRIRLFNSVEMILPWYSKFGTEVYLKDKKLDWGSEELLVQFLERDKSFLDVGANIGYYSLLAAPLSQSVYSFEPDPRILPELDKNLAQFQNTQVVKEALYSEPGEMTLSLHASPELNSLVRQDADGTGITIPVSTLDQFVAEQSSAQGSVQVSAIKTDAEGADFEILVGGKDLLVRDQPLVLSEAYPDQQLLAFAKSIGFTVFAYAKPKDTSKSHLPPTFMKVEQPPSHVRLKMIFLVPERLKSQFESKVTVG
ncbi:MAG: FkbM family methyltransferase [Symploca sp. SIO2B6]|nr:FkbM family methyltransferase [Symploca sp. SIO2B6]